jgi:hypothetical protein
MRVTRAAVAVIAAVLVAFAAAGCAPVKVNVFSPVADGDEASGETGRQSIVLPSFGEPLDYQLGGSYPVDEGVGIVTRDSTSEPADGVYSICYVNGFQSQPGDDERWTTDNPDLVLRDDAGHVIIDPNWPDEFILDTSTPEKRERIVAIVGASINTCAEAGFDAVEIDNLDTYSRSDGRLGIDDNLALAALYAERAHGMALAIGQKNSAELAARGRDQAHFDFAVTEECVRFEECAAFSDVYGKAVVDIEYTDDLPGSFADVCATEDRPASTTLRDRNLVVKGDADYVFEHC